MHLIFRDTANAQILDEMIKVSDLCFASLLSQG